MLSGAALRRVNLAHEVKALWDKLEEAGHGPIACDIFAHYETQALHHPHINSFVEEENERRQDRGEEPLNQREERDFRHQAVQDGLTNTGVAGWPSSVISRFADALREEVKDRGLRSWD